VLIDRAAKEYHFTIGRSLLNVHLRISKKGDPRMNIWSNINKVRENETLLLAIERPLGMLK
jgi:hypothetical protein